MPRIPKLEFENRVENLREKMRIDNTDVFMIYGDEYRRENLRYVSNYWPIFERGMLVVGMEGEPVLLVSPEGERLAREMSPWEDVRLVREVSMSYIPEEVEYTNVNFTTLRDVINEVSGKTEGVKLKIAGLDAMSVVLYDAVAKCVKGGAIGSGDSILYELRYVKSPIEVEMLRKAWEICDVGYSAVLNSDIVGLTEIQAAAIGEKAARDAGAEHIVFSIFASGERTNTVVGRPTEKVIGKGEMIMYALAVQYEGYIATDEWPFVAGGEPSREQYNLIYHLVKAEDIGVKNLRSGVVQGDVVKAIKNYFKENGLEKYDLYPPIHGNGLAEAESPYPGTDSANRFIPGIGVNFDVSLFGIPGVGSNRIEEGFIVGEDELIVLSKLISSLREDFLRENKPARG